MLYIYDCCILYIYIVYNIIHIIFIYNIYIYNNIHPQLHYLHWIDPHWLVSNPRIDPSHPRHASCISRSHIPISSLYALGNALFSLLSPIKNLMIISRNHHVWCSKLPSEVWTKVHWIFPVTIPWSSDGTLWFCPQQIATWGFNQKNGGKISCRVQWGKLAH